MGGHSSTNYNNLSLMGHKKRRNMGVSQYSDSSRKSKSNVRGSERLLDTGHMSEQVSGYNSLDNEIEDLLKKQKDEEMMLQMRIQDNNQQAQNQPLISQNEMLDENEDADKILEYSERILQQYLGQEGQDLYNEKKAHVTLRNHPMETINERSEYQ